MATDSGVVSTAAGFRSTLFLGTYMPPLLFTQKLRAAVPFIFRAEQQLYQLHEQKGSTSQQQQQLNHKPPSLAEVEQELRERALLVVHNQLCHSGSGGWGDLAAQEALGCATQQLLHLTDASPQKVRPLLWAYSHQFTAM